MRTRENGRSSAFFRPIDSRGVGETSGRFDLARARLAKADAERSAALERDRRVYEPDPDEDCRPCGARRNP